MCQKKTGRGDEELTVKQKEITVGQRLWGSCRGWRCPRARPWTNQIATESKIGQMLSWNKLGMFDFLFLCTFGSWRRRWWVTNILIPRRLQRVRSRKADTIFSSVMCFLFFYHYHLFSIDILPAVLEALGQRRHHVLVVFHQGSEDMGSLTSWWKYGAGHLLEYGGVLRHVVQIQKFREVVEDVEGSDV